MPAIALSQYNSIPDILDQTRYQFKFGSIPGVANDAGILTLTCFNASMPGRSNEMFEAPAHGFVRKFSGRNMYPRVITCSFYEVSNAGVHKALHGWLEFMRGTNSGNSGGYSNDYTIDAECSVYDTTGAEAMRYQFQHFTVLDVPDVSLSGESSVAMQVAVQFSYETFECSTFAVA